MCIRDRSNQEAGKGRYDIVLQSKTSKFPSYIIELKYLKKEEYDKHPKLLKEKCEEALRQIEMNRYDITLSGQIIHIALTPVSYTHLDMRWMQEEADIQLEQMLITELEKEKVLSYGS